MHSRGTSSVLPTGWSGTSSSPSDRPTAGPPLSHPLPTFRIQTREASMRADVQLSTQFLQVQDRHQVHILVNVAGEIPATR